MSGNFRVLEHTADVGFEAYGSTREEVFASAARALTELMVETAAIVPREPAEFHVEGDSAAGLLVNWLSEILYRFDAEGWLYADYEVTDLSERSLAARARGERFDRTRHTVKVQVKAITYHQLLLEETPQGWRARVFLDI
jgi:protein archease